MKWTVFVALTLIGLVAADGNGAWKKDREYKYKLIVKTFVTLPQENKQNGQVSFVHLTIRPRSSSVLVAQITRAGYGEANEQDSKENGSYESRVFNQPEPQSSALVDESLKKPFEIHLRNGAIQSISVDDSLTTDQINQLKYIVSQFQVDTKAERAVNQEHNHLPDGNANNAFFVAMEPTVTGACETTYDISRVPEYMANEKRYLVPKPELVGDGHIIQITKTKNYEKCNEKTRYVTDLAGHRGDINRMNGVLDNSRIVITGTLNDYTIQSALTSKNFEGFSEYSSLTLESVDRINPDDSSNSNRRLDNLKYIYGLVHREDPQNQLRQMDGGKRANSPLARVPLSRSQFADSSSDEAWSGCWTGFVASENICKLDFSAEWAPIGGNCCGFLCLGHKALCKRTFPGCEATICYSVFIKGEDMCEKSFNGRLPVPKGGFTDCAPGFWGARCCPE